MIVHKQHLALHDALFPDTTVYQNKGEKRGFKGGRGVRVGARRREV